ncbi:hypothetical protein [Brevibacillus agri]|uniref:hypothetical protein n=1 Tax=Brevibacillus agri TaxID=51101 RepID=UPI0025B6D657|nr:hypothetical protein [Brevibacillus agri]MDN4096262.1 hypothetical protein [Brevibacillus agri]
MDWMRNEEFREIIDECIQAVSDLLNDLYVSNPTYRYAMDVGNNPVIYLCLRLLGEILAEPIGDPIGQYVRFDIPKIRELQKELEEFKANLKE